MCDWIYENQANIITTTLRLFQENSQAVSTDQPRAVCQQRAYLPSLLVSGWLAAGR